MAKIVSSVNRNGFSIVFPEKTIVGSWSRGVSIVPRKKLTLEEEAERRPVAVVSRLMLAEDWDLAEEFMDRFIHTSSEAIH